MTREQFRKEIINLEIEYSKNNEYSIACYDKDYTILNRYFDNGEVFYINFTTNEGYFHCSVSVHLSNGKTVRYYESDCPILKEMGIDNHSINEEQMIAIVKFLKDRLAKKQLEIQEKYNKGKSQISIDELYTQCLKAANDVIKEHKFNDFRASICFGKQLCDHKQPKYFIICIEYFGNAFGEICWNYGCGFRLYKDRYGINYIERLNYFHEKSEFNIDDFKQYVLNYCIKDKKYI